MTSPSPLRGISQSSLPLSSLRGVSSSSLSINDQLHRSRGSGSVKGSGAKYAASSTSDDDFLHEEKVDDLSEGSYIY
jgi:hypothetical protein